MKKRVMMRKIVQVSSLLLSAVIGAIVLAVFMIVYYGPSGRYVAGDTILSPEMIEQLSYKDLNPKTGQQARFVFNDAEFSYFDKLAGRQRQMPIDFQTYEKFYKMISPIKSVENLTDDMRTEFNRGLLAYLTLTVRTESTSSASYATKVFQTIQWTENDYFRVQLKGQDVSETWAYFHQPGIYQDIMQLLSK